MTIRFGGKIQSTIFLGSVLTMSACASNNSGASITNKTGETPRAAVEQGRPGTPAESPSPGAKRGSEPGKASAKADPDTAQAARGNATRINPKEPYVNIRSAPSLQSRTVAVLKGGHSLEVLEIRDTWMMVKWLKGDLVKQGWLKKRFVEGYEKQH